MLGFSKKMCGGEKDYGGHYSQIEDGRLRKENEKGTKKSRPEEIESD